MASLSAWANHPRFSRRQILRAGAAALSAAPLLRVRRSSAAELGEKLRIAAVGTGNKGWDDLKSCASAPGAKIVAMCDIDSDFLDHARKEFADAKPYRDYRKMLDELGGEIDAVIVSTPDHMHCAISLAAMSLGKHVYVQKPLAHNLAELRKMMEVAAESGVVTQMGTQIHGYEVYRKAVQALRQGVLGKVREAHSWVSSELPLPATARPDRADEIPATVAWDLWQGVAPEHPYIKGFYHPYNWRMWRDYGCGTMGDMGCHLLDPLFGGLDLRPPLSVKSMGPANLPDTFSPDTDVTLTFAGTPFTADEFTLRWTNGVYKADVALAQLPKDVTLPKGGSFVIGELGVMLLPHIDAPSFYSQGAPMSVDVPSPGSVDHYHEWVGACRGEGKTTTPFSYGGMVTEAALVGTVAGNFPQQPLKWNSAELTFDDDAATAMVRRQYREDWRPAGV